MTSGDGDRAEFVVTPSSLPARRPPILAAVVVAGITLAAVAGVLGSGGHGSPESTVAVFGGTAPAAGLTTAPSPTRPARRPAPPPTARPEILALDVRPAGSSLVVHGQVFSLAVDVVVVSVEDPSGVVTSSEAVSLPGGSTAFRIGAYDRFFVRFEVPDEIIADGLWIAADAYDVDGAPLVRIRQAVGAAASDRFGLAIGGGLGHVAGLGWP